MEIREARMEDAEKIYDLELATFSIPWPLDAIKKDLAKGTDKAMYYVMIAGDKVIGYCGSWLVLDEGQITNVAIRKEYRGFGFGTKLVKALVKALFEKNMNEIFLEVRISNTPALKLYRNLGFTVKGVRKKYYVNPTEDAYIMSCEKEG